LLKIRPGDLDASMPYTNLLPLVEAVLAGGNTLVFEGDPFVLKPSGWYCALRDPIDFDLIEASFVLPPTIICSRRRDEIVDVFTRSFITGRGWPGSSLVVSEETSEWQQEFFLALASLPEHDHALMIRRYFKEMSLEELAAQTGLSRQALDTRLWKIRKSLRGRTS
jgi:Sigma-70, region 4